MAAINRLNSLRWAATGSATAALSRRIVHRASGTAALDFHPMACEGTRPTGTPGTQNGRPRLRNRPFASEVRSDYRTTSFFVIRMPSATSV